MSVWLVRCWELFLQVQTVKRQSCVPSTLSRSDYGLQWWERSPRCSDCLVSFNRFSISRWIYCKVWECLSVIIFLWCVRFKVDGLEKSQREFFFWNFSFCRSSTYMCKHKCAEQKTASETASVFFWRVKNRKRKGKDLSFTALGYRYLLSPHVSKSKEESRQVKLEVKKTFAELLFKADNCKWPFEFCSATGVEILSAALDAFDISSLHQEFLEGHLQLFKLVVAIPILHDIIGSSVTSASSEESSVSVQETIATLKSLGA